MSGLLRQGSRGAAVSALQESLNAAGGGARALSVDGFFGSLTRQRVVEFQIANGLSPDGIVGPMTQARIDQRGTGAGGEPSPGGPPLIGGDSPNESGHGAHTSTIISAAESARRSWSASASVSGVIINGPVAIGASGCVSGPSLGSYMMGSLSGLPPFDFQIAEAAAAGIDACWSRMQASISVPGLPWYPLFANYPGRVAPPIPNVPTPLSASVGNINAISSGALGNAMRSQYSGNHPDRLGETLLDAIAFQVSNSFLAWVMSASFRNVLGSGTVPTFAPPAVLCGPVVNGSARSVGPCFL